MDNVLPVCEPVRLFTLDLRFGSRESRHLKFLAVGGIFIGGGIAPHLIEFFKERKFIQSFSDKGRFSSLSQKIPIKIVAE